MIVTLCDLPYLHAWLFNETVFSITRYLLVLCHIFFLICSDPRYDWFQPLLLCQIHVHVKTILFVHNVRLSLSASHSVLHRHSTCEDFPISWTLRSLSEWSIFSKKYRKFSETGASAPAPPRGPCPLEPPPGDNPQTPSRTPLHTVLATRLHLTAYSPSTTVPCRLNASES